MTQVLTPKEAAARIKVSSYTILRWAREGKIESSKTGKTVRFTEEAVDAFLARREAPAPAAS